MPQACRLRIKIKSLRLGGIAVPDRNYVRWFKDIRSADVPSVGGKTASLGELYNALSDAGVRVPNGFALTAEAYRDALAQAGAWEELTPLLAGLERADTRTLARNAAKAREIVYRATGTGDIRRQIEAGYAALQKQYGKNVAVAVRSSATAEDLPTASFAGQHESFLNVRGLDHVVDACRRCFASIFTGRAINYRNNNGFEHSKVFLSVAVMKMVGADKASSGVMFTLDTESGFRDVVFITGSYGLGETIVQGEVDPDEFYVHKPTFKAGHRAVLRHSLGAKEVKLVYARQKGEVSTQLVNTTRADRARYCLTDAEVLELAGHAIAIEDHYSREAGHAMPMDIEWAKDGNDGLIYVIQARPETVASQNAGKDLESYTLKGKGALLVSGRAVGEKIATGKARVIAKKSDLAKFRPGEVLIAETTSPDWQPVMKGAAAIVTDHGGRTCHAAIVARELGVPAVVGADGAMAKIRTGEIVTVSCAGGDIGHIYKGKIACEVARMAIDKIKRPKTGIMVNLGNPDLAFRTAMLPNDGVGLARMEFIINDYIGVHPMALAAPKKVKSAGDRRKIEALTRGYRRPADFFIEKLSEGVGTIAAAFYPKPVIVRLSDFKSNEYASLIAGAGFEPEEDNPMIGFRGASRYTHPAYAAGFALECAALARVRGAMGLTNLKIMVPFCRREEEARKVIASMGEHGLRRGENGLEIFVMCEIPNNVIRIDAFSALFDGFSIGSNDLTQLTLGVDRDSEIVAFDFDEKDPGMLEMLRLAVTGAKRNKRHIGICGEAPANDPEIARFLTRLGIDSISVNPQSVIRTMSIVAQAEASGA
ncbi:MAG: phosphoenolpyruvate synthase [Parvibaculum sp.]|nr:phosphoenolpyruvate synthase [Parvibaculum sp.]MDR3499845.1 phosphoenolpyruvate synthase [Parvibaculum sp.]